MKTKVMTIVGTRPEIIKLSRTIHELDKFTDHILVHTNQIRGRNVPLMIAFRETFNQKCFAPYGRKIYMKIVNFRRSCKSIVCRLK